jgi:hypothetical protein
MNPLTKRYLLIALLSLTGLATVGVIAAMFASTGRSEEFAAVSGLGLGYLVVISLAAFASLDRPWWRIVAASGMALSVVMMLLHPLWAWAECNRVYSYTAGTMPTNYEWYRLFERLNGTGLSTAGVLCLLAYVMSMKIKSFGLLLQVLTSVSMLLLYLVLQSAMWDWRIVTGRREEKLLFALFALTAAGVIVVAILNKFFGIKIANPITYTATTLQLLCPRCHKNLELPAGESACQYCKLKFKIEVEEPLCPTCGYNLHNLTTPRCPECGTQWAGDPAAVAAPAALQGQAIPAASP